MIRCEGEVDGPPMFCVSSWGWEESSAHTVGTIPVPARRSDKARHFCRALDMAVQAVLNMPNNIISDELYVCCPGGKEKAWDYLNMDLLRLINFTF